MPNKLNIEPKPSDYISFPPLAIDFINSVNSCEQALVNFERPICLTRLHANQHVTNSQTFFIFRIIKIAKKIKEKETNLPNSLFWASPKIEKEKKAVHG